MTKNQYDSTNPHKAFLGDEGKIVRIDWERPSVSGHDDLRRILEVADPGVDADALIDRYARACAQVLNAYVREGLSEGELLDEDQFARDFVEGYYDHQRALSQYRELSGLIESDNRDGIREFLHELREHHLR